MDGDGEEIEDLKGRAEAVGFRQERRRVTVTRETDGEDPSMVESGTSSIYS